MLDISNMDSIAANPCFVKHRKAMSFMLAPRMLETLD